MISLCIPTYNESENIVKLLDRVEPILSEHHIEYEILVMDDDSPDKTADLVNNLHRNNVRAINRKGKPRGLAYAVLDGFSNAKHDIVCVMDADMSHPPEKLPDLVKAISEEGFMMSVGSRYVPGGGSTNWPWIRRFISKSCAVVDMLFTPIHDSGSGFIALRKSIIEGAPIDPLGFKVGFEILVKGKHQEKIKEVPIMFTDRQYGKSKLGAKVTLLYVKQLLSMAKYKWFSRPRANDS